MRLLSSHKSIVLELRKNGKVQDKKITEHPDLIDRKYEKVNRGAQSRPRSKNSNKSNRNDAYFSSNYDNSHVNIFI